MTLPTTPGSSLSMNQVNVELGFGGSTAISLQDTIVRSLFEKTTASSTIAFSDGSNKTAIRYTGISGNPVLANNDVFSGGYVGFGPGTTAMNFQSNGQMTVAQGDIFTTTPYNRWAIDGITGGNFYIRFTKTAETGSLDSATASTGWLQMNTARLIAVEAVGGDTGNATYTIEIAGGSGGTPLLTTRTGIVLEVFDEGGFG